MKLLYILQRVGWMTAVLAAASANAASIDAGHHALPLMKLADVPLGGGTTRMDYESYDPDRHLLFIAHLGDSAVIVFNTQSRRVAARITGISKVHGVLAIPTLGRVYATATGTNEVVAIDENTLKIVARAPTGDHPDGMAYTPDAHKLYVSDELGASDTVIDVRSNKRVATIKLGGEAGNSQYDPISGHIFVNVQTLGRLVEINPATDQVIARTDLPGGIKGNHGLLIVPEQRLAFIACEDTARLLVLNLTSRRVVASFNVGNDPDVLAIDSRRGWVYLAAESGVLSIFKAKNGAVTKIAEGMVGPVAHIVAVDPVSQETYFPLKDLHGKTTLRIMQPLR